MTKYKVIYEIEAVDIATATSFAHEVLYMANVDVDKLTVVEFDADDKPVSKSGRTFGGGYSVGGYIPGPAVTTEVNTRVAQHIQDQAREAQGRIIAMGSPADPELPFVSIWSPQNLPSDYTI